jgi:hypothetical protein
VAAQPWAVVSCVEHHAAGPPVLLHIMAPTISMSCTMLTARALAKALSVSRHDIDRCALPLLAHHKASDSDLPVTAPNDSRRHC